MGKKMDKMMDKMEKKNMKEQDNNAKWFRERLFANADDIRSLSSVSQDMNEYSELLDDLVDKMLTMNNGDLHRISRIM